MYFCPIFCLWGVFSYSVGGQVFRKFWQSFPNCAGHLLHRAFWQELFWVIGRLHKVFSANAPITHLNCLGTHYQLHAHLLHKRIVSKLFVYRSVQIDYRQTLFLGRINFQLQIQNRAARRINFHYRDRSVGISAESLSLQIQILS